ncbi:hypothetical protein GCM10023108_32660 [Saccharopolyspora hordei]|uniref:Non-ribosomal peptide synthetase component E (Peptide arylation enzyme) n=1 Tax=Saccharopolyspora hordei TaxID=1838 RepID=A0A853ARU9_9PSEU|nr:non-ribosomal peptide synthetase component E (peptide arylation enzyme) [Saccharopolyspora hordei]
MFTTLLTPDRIARETAAGHWRDRTITDFLDENASTAPDKTAFVDSRGRISYAELKQLVDRVALGFLELGVGPGDVVSFQIPNWIEWVVVHYAASRIGAISNPLIPNYREREVGFMVSLARSKLVVVPRAFRRVRPRRDGRTPPRRLARAGARAGDRRALVGRVHHDTVGGRPRPGGPPRPAARPQRRDAADLHLGHHR